MTYMPVWSCGPSATCAWPGSEIWGGRGLMGLLDVRCRASAPHLRRDLDRSWQSRSSRVQACGVRRRTDRAGSAARGTMRSTSARANRARSWPRWRCTRARRCRRTCWPTWSGRASRRRARTARCTPTSPGCARSSSPERTSRAAASLLETTDHGYVLRVRRRGRRRAPVRRRAYAGSTACWPRSRPSSRRGDQAGWPGRERPGRRPRRARRRAGHLDAGRRTPTCPTTPTCWPSAARSSRCAPRRRRPGCSACWRSASTRACCRPTESRVATQRPAGAAVGAARARADPRRTPGRRARRAARRPRAARRRARARPRARAARPRAGDAAPGRAALLAGARRRRPPSPGHRLRRPAPRPPRRGGARADAGRPRRPSGARLHAAARRSGRGTRGPAGR